MSRRRSPRPEPLALLILTAALGQTAEAQVGYTAEQFDSAHFRHTVQTEIHTFVAGRELRERIAVAGDLVFVAVPASGGSLGLEAWYDSLYVRRTGGEGSFEPDTDGLIGGRYRGRLARDGGYTAGARPFVPEGVADAVDLSRVLDDFFPLLPARPLHVGGRWEAPDGSRIRRLTDSIGRDTLLRFEARRTHRTDSLVPAGDTHSIAAVQSTREVERFAWHPEHGLIRRDRTITIDAQIPRGARVPRAVRSRIAQRVVVERVWGSRGTE